MVVLGYGGLVAIRGEEGRERKVKMGSVMPITAGGGFKQNLAIKKIRSA